MSAQLKLLVELDGRAPYEVSTRLIDHNLWDTTRARHNWPTGSDAPVTWLGFIAWAASRRSGAIEPTLTWEAFLGLCLGVETVDDDEGVDMTKPPDPMGAAPGLDSSAN